MYKVDDYDQCIDTVENRITSPLVSAYLNYKRDVEDMLKEWKRTALRMEIRVPDGTPLLWRYNDIWVEVYKGEFIVDKIIYDDILYKILHPITWVGQVLVSSSGEFFDLYPRYGFHLVTHAICIGEVNHNVRNKHFHYKVEVAKEIVKALQIINMDSLGTEVVLPPEYPHDIFSQIKRENKTSFLRRLKERNLIQEVEKWT